MFFVSSGMEKINKKLGFQSLHSTCKYYLFIMGMFLFTFPCFSQDPIKIWDYAPHQAFTDLVSFKGKFYCTFREGTGHVPGPKGTDGVIRVLSSNDGISWIPESLLNSDKYDLRDPKISVTPDGRLMLVIGGSHYDKGNLLSQLTHVSFSDYDGKNFTPPIPTELDPIIKNDYNWLWRITWHNGVAYGVVYQGRNGSAYLVSSDNGVHYKLVCKLDIDGSPNEASLEFDSEGGMHMIVRRGGGNRMGYYGTAKSPYMKWNWKELDQPLGGPHLALLPNDKIIVVSRYYRSSGSQTAIFELQDNHLEVIEVLPSGGDTSYPGLVLQDNKLYISYYSNHSEKTSIYLAKRDWEKW